MLSNPNINEILPKVGNRYEAVLAISKRARAISKKRVEEGSDDIRDAVDVAAEEIVENRVYVRKNGKYVVEPNLKLDKSDENYVKDIVKE